MRMNRRGFLGALAAVALAPFLPAPAPRYHMPAVRYVRVGNLVTAYFSSHTLTAHADHFGFRLGDGPNDDYEEGELLTWPPSASPPTSSASAG